MTTPIGAGLATAGTTPAGLGEPVTSEALSPYGYDLSPTGAVSSVEIDGASRDYVFDDDTGSEEGMSDAGQRIWFLLATKRGSRANFGNFGFKLPPKQTSQSDKQVKDAIEQALAPVINDGSVRIDSIEVLVQGTSAYAVVRWIDMATSQRRSTKTLIRA